MGGSIGVQPFTLLDWWLAEKVTSARRVGQWRGPPRPATLAAMNPARTDHARTMDAFFASYHSRRPVNATFVGVHEHDHRLPDLSESGVGDTLADMSDLAARLRGPGEGLTAAEQMDRRLASGFLEIQEWEYRSDQFNRGNPSYHTGEAIFSILGLFLTDSGPIADRVESAMARMDAIPGFLSVAREAVRKAPVAWTRRAIRECDGALSLFTEGMAALSADHPDAIPNRFASLAEGCANAFASHRSWLETELSTRPAEDVACGPEALDRYLRSGHFLEQSADEISRYAVEQMAEAEALVARGVAALDFASAEEVMERLAEMHPTPDGYLNAFDSTWHDQRALAEDRALVSWPDFPIRYVERPGWTQAAAPYLYFLFYRSPAAENRPPVHDYLVAPLPTDGQEAFLRGTNDSVIKLNHVVHHGGLGHHVQNWHAFRAESRVGRMAAVDCASRIAMFCGATMAEGWACYATDLAGEFGGLTELELFAETRGRVRMAARAFVDVEMHSGRMTLDEASAVYERRAGMPSSAARAEAVKNSMFPGAALIYLMGSDAIHDLRAEVSRKQGSDFDLKRFHDDFLSYGSVPVALIAEQMTKPTNEGTN